MKIDHVILIFLASCAAFPMHLPASPKEIGESLVIAKADILECLQSPNLVEGPGFDLSWEVVKFCLKWEGIEMSCPSTCFIVPKEENRSGCEANPLKIEFRRALYRTWPQTYRICQDLSEKVHFRAGTRISRVLTEVSLNAPHST